MVDHLFVRATYIVKRLVEITEVMLENARRSRKRTNPVASDVLEDLDQYPFFTHAGNNLLISCIYHTIVKDLYYKFVDATAEECKKKCKDEFFCTRLVYWELTK